MANWIEVDSPEPGDVAARQGYLDMRINRVEGDRFWVVGQLRTAAEYLERRNGA